MSSNAITAIDSKKPSTKQELIAANIKLLIEQLEAGHSEFLTNYLTAMSRFHQYSFGNVLEIARQMPTATRVAGFWTWKNLGRNVKAGQKGIRILAPIVGVRRKKDKEAEKDITKQNERASADYIQLYHGNASLLAESLEVIQQTASVILAALEPPVADEATTEEIAEVAA
jgi:hypothetical protein